MLTLRQWRLAREKTIADMAEACGVHPNTYMAWEKNPDCISISAARKIAEALDIGIDVLFFGAEYHKTE